MLVASNSYEYIWRVPRSHPQGLYWYHPHPHGISEDQVLGGLSGMLVVEGLIDEHYPELRNLKRRTFLLKDIQLPGAPDSAPKTKTINGVLGGVMQSGPGRFEIWEIGNIGADSYFNIALDGHRFWVIERDGNPVSLPQFVDHVYLPPSSRAMIVVRIGPAGTYNLRTRSVATGGAGDPNPNVVLARVASSGTPVDRRDLAERMTRPPANPATIGPTEASIRRLPVTRQRTIVYTENAAGTKFFLNGKAFDMSRVDVFVNLGDVEEWTLVNNTDERHTFHIHQLDFLVQALSSTNTLETTRGLRDNIDIPFRDPVTRAPGIVKVKIPFTNPVIVGMFPFHCHILEHEDGGMMQNLVVLPAPARRGD
jgi:FtsP/CotA-like multicopper oxidase with cupredoxin domain